MFGPFLGKIPNQVECFVNENVNNLHNTELTDKSSIHFNEGSKSNVINSEYNYSIDKKDQISDENNCVRRGDDSAVASCSQGDDSAVASCSQGDDRDVAPCSQGDDRDVASCLQGDGRETNSDKNRNNKNEESIQIVVNSDCTSSNDEARLLSSND